MGFLTPNGGSSVTGKKGIRRVGHRAKVQQAKGDDRAKDTVTIVRSAAAGISDGSVPCRSWRRILLPDACACLFSPFCSLTASQDAGPRS